MSAWAVALGLYAVLRRPEGARTHQNVKYNILYLLILKALKKPYTASKCFFDIIPDGFQVIRAALLPCFQDRRNRGGVLWSEVLQESIKAIYNNIVFSTS